MFTGIVRAMGTVAEVRSLRGDTRLYIEPAGMPQADYAPGDSIAVNGVCLTVAELGSRGFACDISRETLGISTLGTLRRGSKVNLEPALTLADRLGGHLVIGHVDGVGTVTERCDDARSIRLEIDMPAALGRYVATKGSVCVDGASLTTNRVSATSFSVNIIPHTAVETIAGDYRRGTQVNIEVDLIARYLERLISQDDAKRIDRSLLEANGYA